MKTPALLAILTATALVAAGAATVVTLAWTAPSSSQAHEGHAHHTGADMEAMHGGLAGDDPHAQIGMERPSFPQASGSVPTAKEADGFKQLSRIHITKDADFNPSNGVTSGNGTLQDPYRITGLHVTGDLYIADTDACVEIAGNWIDRQLILNWDGPCVWVHHNYIRDLRVNENVRRTGIDTGGLIELNKINYVGQIRHFDGEFRNNLVGPRDDANLPEGIFHDLENLIPFFHDTRVLNVDGWNQGLFHHNTVHGSVDLKLHGHHHGTGFFSSHSHYHGNGEARHDEDHTQRWQSVTFTDNHVIDTEGYGLRYVDEMHSGDDRKAPSETHADLEKPHTHYTLVEISRNVLEGAGIWVDVFNADDRQHKTRNPGWFTIADNTVHLKSRESGMLGEQFFGPRYAPNTGIWVWQAKEVQMTITGNTLTFQAVQSNDPLHPVTGLSPDWLQWGPDETPVAVSLEVANDGNYTVTGNKATGFEYGVKARQMDEHAQWAVYGNDFKDTRTPIYFDGSVANKPSEEPLEAGPSPQDAAPAKEEEHEHH